MSVEPFSADQQDALQEIANLAMGRAGAVLAEMLDVYIELSVPRVAIVEAGGLTPEVEALTGRDSQVAAVRQPFMDGVSGEALALFGEGGCRGLADLLGHDSVDETVERELLLDVSNILLGSVLRGLGEHTATRLSLGRPAIMSMGSPVARLLNAEDLIWDQALMLEVNFRLDARGFACHLLLLMPEQSIETMRHAVDRILDGLG
ncbi:hypothetical protein KBTX_03791 [wastewater metagenome]|uniref:CheC-like protein domain-containing protein n=3 Tax=root TaxID=1 RepID=A0A5B8REY9_9ZZZZ|nr:chemotaxis protein CheC [Arhodomonas aquaeolei]MCS4505604.1 chemotaxis protein CheC [Arhodomonas aquaeolei]QEA07440.1 hypothetical protein KBTEX_03791 [uncultured organism]